MMSYFCKGIWSIPWPNISVGKTIFCLGTHEDCSIKLVTDKDELNASTILIISIILLSSVFF